MLKHTKIRAAVAQFHVGSDLDVNLAACLRALDRAARESPHIVVLPEFCNHLSWYDDLAHCKRVSVRLGDSFLRAIASKAAEIGAYVSVNVTLNSDDGRTSGACLLFAPDGTLAAKSDKQILIGHENDFLDRANAPGPIIESPVGRLGLYACMDGVINETPRCLALRGAQILLNNLNSFASDEASLHIPVRAAENKVFVVAANKIGPLVPEAMLPAISAATGIPAHFLNGAGESQIVGPDGRVLAKASLNQEEVVFAEFDPREADDKRRPDGTDVFASRRPSLYAPIAADPAAQSLPSFDGPLKVKAALIHASLASKTTTLAAEAFANGAKIIAFAPVEGLEPEILRAVIPAGCYAAISTGDRVHLVSAQGSVMAQAPLHQTRRFGAQRADSISTLATPLGRIALVAGDDSLFPETFRLVAMTGAEIVIAPVTPLETWELQTGLIERAAENRVNLLAPAAGAVRGFAATLQTDFTILTPWAERKFDGILSQPEIVRASADITYVTLRPRNAANKVVSSKTDLLAGRPWQLATPITAPLT